MPTAGTRTPIARATSSGRAGGHGCRRAAPCFAAFGARAFPIAATTPHDASRRLMFAHRPGLCITLVAVLGIPALSPAQLLDTVTYVAPTRLVAPVIATGVDYRLLLA